MEENNFEFKLESYRELRSEFKQYQFLTQRLWTYKFAVIGAVISIAVFNDTIIANSISQSIGITIPILGILILPLLSFMIDFKLLQIGLHIKRISDFIAENFKDIPIVEAWETKFWSGKRSKLIGYIEITSSVGTSILILVSCFTIVGMSTSGWAWYLIIIGFVFLGSSLIAVRIFYLPLWKSD